MEWAEDSQFEDHASLIFLNRNLPVPAFSMEKKGRTLAIDTGKLHLVYRDVDKAAGFTAGNLEITSMLDGRPVAWHPGVP